MADAEQSDGEGASATFRFRDDLPPICVLCGAPATGLISQKVALPADAQATAMWLLSGIGLLFGFLTFWWRTSPGGAPDNKWVGLPHCPQHDSPEALREEIRIVAVNRHMADIYGAAPKFLQALAVLCAPPSDELLGAVDKGPAGDADEFLKGLDKSAVRTPGEFLKGLEGDSDKAPADDGLSQ